MKTAQSIKVAVDDCTLTFHKDECLGTSITYVCRMMPNIVLHRTLNVLPWEAHDTQSGRTTACAKTPSEAVLACMNAVFTPAERTATSAPKVVAGHSPVRMKTTHGDLNFTVRNSRALDGTLREYACAELPHVILRLYHANDTWVASYTKGGIGSVPHKDPKAAVQGLLDDIKDQGKQAVAEAERMIEMLTKHQRVADRKRTTISTQIQRREAYIAKHVVRISSLNKELGNVEKRITTLQASRTITAMDIKARGMRLIEDVRVVKSS
jgi:polyhydroxyalkanoate synthesis regulator phasin